jgi:hypothetical protein
MYTYILPTIFATDKLDIQLRKVLENPLISEVILVINTNIDQLGWDHPKLSKVPTNIPQYCNGAWNIGVNLAKTEYIILATDDIVYDTSIFSIVSKELRNENVGIIGCNEQNLSQPVRHLDESNIIYMSHISRPFGFGQMMFMDKSRFIHIPEQLKHWYGDDWLFYHNKINNKENYSITGTFWLHSSVSESSANVETQNRILEDTIWWESNNQPFQKFFYR